MTGHCACFYLLRRGVIFLAIASAASLAYGDLIITEIMYDPASNESHWEWIEVFNNGATDVDVSGYVFDDGAGAALSAANIASGSIPAGGVGVIFDAVTISTSDFVNAWENAPGAPSGLDINLIPVSTNFPGLNNDGDRLGLWTSFSAYDSRNFGNALDIVEYGTSSPWPSNNNSASIYLDVPLNSSNLATLNDSGSNWNLSGGTTTGWQSANAGGNSGNDFGSPGFGTSSVPEPSVLVLSAAIAFAGLGTYQSYRRRSRTRVS
jgi:hypothetical protein